MHYKKFLLTKYSKHEAFHKAALLNLLMSFPLRHHLEKIMYCIFPCCVDRNIKICHQCKRVIRDFESIYFVCNTDLHKVPLEDNNLFCSNNCRAKYLLEKYPSSPTDSYTSSSVFSISSAESTPTNYEVAKTKTRYKSSGFNYHEF